MNRRSRLLALALVAAVGLIAVTLVLFVRHRRLERRIANTRAALESVCEFVANERDPLGERPPLVADLPHDGRAYDLARALKTARASVQWTLDDEGRVRVSETEGGEVVGSTLALERGTRELRDPNALPPPVLDVWGRPLRFRCPGKLHPKGADIRSAGPDGEDEGGEGDDIVVGFDVETSSSGSADDAPVSSGTSR